MNGWDSSIDRPLRDPREDVSEDKEVGQLLSENEPGRGGKNSCIFDDGGKDMILDVFVGEYSEKDGLWFDELKLEEGMGGAEALGGVEGRDDDIKGRGQCVRSSGAQCSSEWG